MVNWLDIVEALSPVERLPFEYYIGFHIRMILIINLTDGGEESSSFEED